MEFFIAFVVFSIIGVLGVKWLWKGRAQQWNSIGSDMKEFDRAVSLNNLHDIIRIGEKLCRNRYLDKPKLEIISTYVELNIEKYPELEELRVAVLNKLANWQKEVPSW